MQSDCKPNPGVFFRDRRWSIDRISLSAGGSQKAPVPGQSVFSAPLALSATGRYTC